MGNNMQQQSRVKTKSGFFFEDELTVLKCPHCGRVLLKSDLPNGLKLEIKCPNRSCGKIVPIEVHRVD